MEQKSKNISLNAILIAIGLGIWVMVLQNAGVIPKIVGTEHGTQTVYVTGGNINADVSGSVSVENEVDINISSVNGRQAKSYSNGLLGVSCN